MTASKHINDNDEERILAMLLILVLALLFCPSLAEEELRGVKHKYADSHPVTICNDRSIHDK